MKLFNWDNRSPRFCVIDVAVYIFMLLVGVWQFTHCLHSADFVNDTTYSDLARSIIEKGSYQIDFSPETMYPPGLALILASAGWLFGLTPAVLLHVMAICTTLGLIAAYELLRRLEGRVLAAVCCVLLSVSPRLFTFATQEVFSDLPFFFVSIVALLLALKINHTKERKARRVFLFLFGIALVSAVLIRSSGVALLIALCAWLAQSFLVNARQGWGRFRWFVIPILLGVSAQLIWTKWATAHQTIHEWQLGGWPQSYVAQLKVKNGNQPELGAAHLRDIPSRVCANTVSSLAGFGYLLTGEWVSQFWSSPAIIGAFILIVMGLGSSFFRHNGAQLYDWYFLFYEIMYLVWPWNSELRFLFPIAPMTCLYLWRGVKVVKACAIRHPKPTAFCFIVGGAFLAVLSTVFTFNVFQSTIFSYNMDHLQPPAAAFVWLLTMLMGIAMLRSISRHDAGSQAFAPMFIRVRTLAGVMLVLMLTVVSGRGVAREVRIGEENVHFQVSQSPYYPDIEAAEWIRAHEPADRVVMARDKYIVYHYSNHKVVWFPPISAPNVLIEGVLRNDVALIVVINRIESYWVPPEDDCFRQLMQVSGGGLYLVHRGPDNWVYEVRNLRNMQRQKQELHS